MSIFVQIYNKQGGSKLIEFVFYYINWFSFFQNYELKLLKHSNINEFDLAILHILHGLNTSSTFY